MNKILNRSDAIYTAYALHQACGIPWGVVIENYICAVEIHALGQDLSGNDYIVIIATLFWSKVGIKVFRNAARHLIAVLGCDCQRAVSGIFQGALNGFEGINSFREDYYTRLILTTWIIDFRIEKFGNGLFETLKFGIEVISVPTVE